MVLTLLVGTVVPIVSVFSLGLCNHYRKTARFATSFSEEPRQVGHLEAIERGKVLRYCFGEVAGGDSDAVTHPQTTLLPGPHFATTRELQHETATYVHNSHDAVVRVHETAHGFVVVVFEFYARDFKLGYAEVVGDASACFWHSDFARYESLHVLHKYTMGKTGVSRVKSAYLSPSEGRSGASGTIPSLGPGLGLPASSCGSGTPS